MQFKEVIGQQQLKQQFAQTILSGKIPHAQLFLGNMGHGGLALALAYAQMLNCESPADNDSCGTCPSCTKAHKLIHPDIHFSYPFPGTIKKDEKVKLSTELMSYWRSMVVSNPYFTLQDWMQQFDSENRQPNITVDECHDIIKRLNLRSFESKYKVMLIWLPEYLGNAGNTLLKILEEPPADTIFILIAENQDAILNTILSRTQIVKIRSIENNALRDALIERHDALSDNATNTASLASGDYIEAVKLLADEASSSAMMFIEWMQMCVQPNLTSNSVAMTQLIGWLEQFSKAGRENQKNVIRYGLHISERLFGYQINGNLDGLNETEQQFVKNFSGKITLNNIDSYYHQLNNCHFYLERNANIKLLMMTMSLRMSRLFIGEVVADALVLS